MDLNLLGFTIISFSENQLIALLQSNVRILISSTKVSANDDELSFAKLRTKVSLMQK